MVETSPQQHKLVPFLESGDRLTRYEFQRRYNAMPDLRKAELIEGVVYIPTARRFRSHGQPHANLTGLLWTYKMATPGIELAIEPTVRLDLDNEPQPDAVLLIESGGQARLSEHDYIEGAPELGVEIAASSAAIDLGDKKRAYRRSGIREYIVWQVFEQRLDWFYLQNREYLLLPVDEDGVIRSQVFPGLWLATNDLLAGNMGTVLSVLQSGLAAPEHTSFVQPLGKKKGAITYGTRRDRS